MLAVSLTHPDPRDPLAAVNIGQIAEPEPPDRRMLDGEVFGKVIVAPGG
jgi:hypothetical protein